MAPSDPITIALLAIVLEDVSTSFSETVHAAQSNSKPTVDLKGKRRAAIGEPRLAAKGPGSFPGLPSSTVGHLDSMAAAIHESIMRGEDAAPTGGDESISMAQADEELNTLEQSAAADTSAMRESSPADEEDEKDEETLEEGGLSEEQEASGVQEMSTGSWRTGPGDEVSMEETMDMD